MMDLPSLRVFVAAVEERSLARAGEREHLGTSAASKRMAELERQVGTRLLVRHGRGVTPTPAGTMLYQRALAILRNVNSAEQALKAFAINGLSQVRLAANPSTFLESLPRQISEFCLSYPGARVDLIEAFSVDVPRQVIDGDADVGIYHAQHPAVGVTSVPYRTDRVGVVVPLGHPLCARPAWRLEDALEYDFIGYLPRHSVESFMELAGSTLSRPPNVRVQVSNYEARCRMVREGLGIAIVPESIGRRYAAGIGLSVQGLTDPWATRQFYVCRMNSDRTPTAAQALFDKLVASVDG
jgi:DNA-binding transcriptional LysR family regulator